MRINKSLCQSFIIDSCFNVLQINALKIKYHYIISLKLFGKEGTFAEKVYSHIEWDYDEVYLLRCR